MSKENQYLQELNRQGKHLTNELLLLKNDYDNIQDLIVKVKLLSIIEKKEEKLLKLKKEVELWHLEIEH